MTKEKVFGFDVGLASLGIAVREGIHIKEAASLLIDAEFGSVADMADRRRQYRVRLAHKAREKYWEDLWVKIKKEPLKGRQHIRSKTGIGFDVIKGDPRLEREFPTKGDKTVYTSSLLRIKLLEGERLEDWQIYKAIRSALQRRGYDAEVDWAKGIDKSKDLVDKENNPEVRIGAFEKAVDKFPEQYRFPCYYDAYKMGLWNPKKGIIKIQIDNKADRARNYVAPREMVTKELEQLLIQASKLIPALKKEQIDKILYGEPEYDGEEVGPYKHTKKHLGILAQKKPRFDNRCVSHCCLIPRYQVVRADEPINLEVNFLISLSRMTYHIEGIQEKYKLNPEQIKDLYEQAKQRKHKLVEKWKADERTSPDADKKAEKIANCYKLTQAQWKTYLNNSKSGIEGRAYPVANYEEVTKPKTDGRSRFSKPALILMKELILSGKEPRYFYDELMDAIKQAEKDQKNQNDFGVRIKDYKFRLRGEDINFLLKIQVETGGIYIPVLSLAEKYFDDQSWGNSKKQDKQKIKQAIQNLIGSTQNYVVRHRLSFFYQELKKLKDKHGTPDKVIFEFAREEFMGAEAKKKHSKYTKDREAIYKDAKKDVEEYGLSGKRTIKKISLLKEQNYTCPFSKFLIPEASDGLSHSQSNKYEIEHIIPQGNKFNGPDTLWNIVITTREVNDKKGERAPYEFVHPDQWEAYCEHIKSLTKLDGKKKKLLMAANKEEVEELMERYYGLAVTSMIARMARDIVCLYFGWQPAEKGKNQKVIVVTGGLVAKIRRRYSLDKLLGDWDENKKQGKDRNDKRHHALDAMVISYLPQWATDKDKSKFFKFPIGINKDYFSAQLDKIYPEYRKWVKAALVEQPLGVITNPDTKNQVAVTRKNLEEYLAISLEKSVDKNIKAIGSLSKKINKIVDRNIRGQLLDLHYSLRDGNVIKKLNEQEASTFIEDWKKSISDLGESNKSDATKIKRIRITASEDGNIDYLKNLSKDESESSFGGQYYANAKNSSAGTMRHGFYIIRGEQTKDKYVIESVHSFLSPHEHREKLIRQGYEIYEDRLFKRQNTWIQVNKKVGEAEPGAYVVYSTSHDRVVLATQQGIKLSTIDINNLLVDGECIILNDRNDDQKKNKT